MFDYILKLNAFFRFMFMMVGLGRLVFSFSVGVLPLSRLIYSLGRENQLKSSYCTIEATDFTQNTLIQYFHSDDDGK